MAAADLLAAIDAGDDAAPRPPLPPTRPRPPPATATG